MLYRIQVLSPFPANLSGTVTNVLAGDTLALSAQQYEAIKASPYNNNIFLVSTEESELEEKVLVIPKPADMPMYFGMDEKAVSLEKVDPFEEASKRMDAQLDSLISYPNVTPVVNSPEESPATDTPVKPVAPAPEPKIELAPASIKVVENSEPEVKSKKITKS
jgi:hypothetical protein